MQLSIPHSSVRIIAGKYRHRKIFFDAEPGLRPTHDRIRETLFNWLQPVIENSVCLDAFAGSGALGFEALSRGAKQVVFFDTSKKVISNLKENAKVLGVDNAVFFYQDFFCEAAQPAEPRDPGAIHRELQQFDIIFLDPPFQKNILLSACEFIIKKKLLKPNGLVYLEFPRGEIDGNCFPATWEIQKQGHTKTLVYCLLQRTG
ncbi:MAG: 16S rRNA (guanine(966)-N(2))-methyltransferase RsmD [Gammaproteobacteria bacterium RIFCSPHIGHO2_12_FULL_38_14]|nr:MAG: 16S rRNA (guanine(966)-N(2))-methyltransferase RsmD [Gammaproteobacteria bacterium RIFCSPHIGHO2_12_FULL_38_14]